MKGHCQQSEKPTHTMKENTFNHISDMGMISGIYKVLPQVSNKKTNPKNQQKT